MFSNGLYDPWSAYGLQKSVSASVVAVLIEDGAHHVDLMFARPEDSVHIKRARQTELQHIRRWIQQAYKDKAAVRQQQHG